MQHKIEWIEHKEWQGKKYAKASVTSLDGQKYEEVSIGDKWGEKLATLMPGMTVEGNMWQNPKNGKWSIYPVEERMGTGGNFRSQKIEQAMDKKTHNIEKFQDKKEESIALAGAQRDAVLIVTEMMRADSGVETLNEGWIKSEIIKWRNWFLSDDFKNHPPF